MDELDLTTNAPNSGAGQDNSPMEEELTVQGVDPFEHLEGGEPASEQIVDIQEESYLDGKYKSAKELEAYAKRLELEREYTQNQQITPTQLKQYGIDLDLIPTEERAQVNQFTQKHLGMSLEQAAIELAEGRRLRQENNQLRASKQVEAQQLELKETWGDHYNEIMAAVKAEYNLLPEHDKPQYNTVRGALLLGVKHQVALLKNPKAATPTVPGVKTPEMLRASVPPKGFSSGNKVYSASAIDAKAEADPAWYRANADTITKLYQQGRIK
jgi:hypothetical protein